jgi:hypothetical protein
MSKLAKDTAVVSFDIAASEDHSAKRGHFTKLASGKTTNIASATADLPIGCILDGGNQTTGTPDSVAVCGGGAGVAKVKLSASPGSVVAGSYLVLDGSTLGTVKLDPASGTRVQCARALEAGAANELIDAVLLDPVILA